MFREKEKYYAKMEIRPWQIEDADSIAYHANNMNIAGNLRDIFPHPYTKKDAEFYIRMCLDANPKKEMYRTISVDNLAVGSISLIRGNDIHCMEAELGYFLSEDYWDLGITTKAIPLICKEAFESWDIVRIYAEVFAFNIPSRRVLEHNGFRLEGTLQNSICKNGVLQNSCIYALLKEDFSMNCSN